MECGCNSEQKKMLYDIGKVSFAVVEMNLYLDTHPKDQVAMKYFDQYNQIRNKLMEEYAAKFGPLTIADASKSRGKWEWAKGPMPWEGVYN